jgi:hypothetical protein
MLASFGEEFRHCLEQAGQFDGLGLEGVASRVEGFFAISGHGVSSQCHDGNRLSFEICLYLPRRLPSVYDRQAHIHQDEIRRISA